MTIYCKNISSYIEVEGGQSLLSIFEGLKDRMGGVNPICARVNNKTEDLSFQIFMPKQVEFLDEMAPSGHRVYVRSLCLMLYKAVTDVLPDAHLTIDHSISKGYFCRLLDPATGLPLPVDQKMCSRLLARMRELQQAALPIERREMLTKDAIEIFRRQRLDNKVLLLETGHELYTSVYFLEGLADCYYGPLAINTSMMRVFNIVLQDDGFLLMGIDPLNRDVPQQPVTQHKMLQAFREYLNFNKVIQVSTVGELNRAVSRRQTASLINVAEAMHDKLLGRISDEIMRRRADGGARVVLIAGPSSSGKTTSTKRLAIQLMTNLIVPKMISLDDYFVNRDRTPREPDGTLDYESLYALDLERLNADLQALLRGEEINLPTYSFEFGKRVERHRPLRLASNEILLIEGIHGLNPELTSSIPQDDIFKIYVSALTTLKLDDHNWIPTTDNRLLRRIVRDNKYRHTSALDTISRWASVRRGEEKWIFPFQENADATFNSSLIFELGVMKNYVEPLLHQVPHDVTEYSEAYRLLRFLSYFDPIPSDQIPSTSLLREFLGGSSFRY